MIKWVFFDIGDVLFSEDAPHMLLFHTLLQSLRSNNKTVEWDEWNAKRCELAAQGPNPEAAMHDAVRAYSDSDSEAETIWKQARLVYGEIRRPRPFGVLQDGITEVLRDLKSSFQLGIIANQHVEVAQAVRDYGIGELFDIVVISEAVNLFKPDPAIFQFGLDAADIQAHEAIFVGDRPDNDIYPAKRIGMKTVRLKRGIHYVLYNPTEPELVADRTVLEISSLANAIRDIALPESELK